MSASDLRIETRTCWKRRKTLGISVDCNWWYNPTTCKILFDTILQFAKYSLIQSYNLQNTLWYNPTTCKILFYTISQLANPLWYSPTTCKILFDTILQLAKYSLIQSDNLQNCVWYNPTTCKILFDTIPQLAKYSLIQSHNLQILFDTILQLAKYSLIQSYNFKILFDTILQLAKFSHTFITWSRTCSNEVIVLRMSFFKCYFINRMKVLRRVCCWVCLHPGERK